MKTKNPTHTPGPWLCEITNEGNIGSKDKVRVEAVDGHIAIACRNKRIDRNTFGPVPVARALPEVKANARLIAAAPELLAALKALAAHRPVPCRFTITKKADDCYTCGKNDRLCQQCSEVVSARAAIAKAEGI